MTVARHTDATAVGSAPASTRHEHVLVPIDGSERSTVALRTGRELAARLGATLHTVSVATDQVTLDRLRTAAAAALGAPMTDPRVHTIDSDQPAEAIAELADRLGSCIVCMSTHAHDRLAGAVLGSVARELLRIRSEPVVMIGPLADRPVYMGDAWAEPLAIARVVVCVDADRPNRKDKAPPAPSAASSLVAIAAGWATALGMSLTILNVAAPPAPVSGTAEVDELEEWIARLAADVAGGQLDVDTHVELDPIGTADGVSGYLSAHPAGLLVVSTHARTGLDRLVHGATAAGITAASTIATLVVPIPDKGARP